MHVAAVARHEEGRDLARPFRKHLVAAGPARENYEYRPRLVALADQIMTRGYVLGLAAGRFEQFDVLRRQRCMSAELVDERVRHSPLSGREG